MTAANYTDFLAGYTFAMYLADDRIGPKEAFARTQRGETLPSDTLRPPLHASAYGTDGRTWTCISLARLARVAA